MTTDQWLVATIAVVVGWSARGAGAFVGAYLPKKGSNRADLEDTEGITRLQEGVRHGNAVELEHVRLRNQLATAAIERRLQIHQEAFTRLFNVFFHVHEPDGRKVAVDNIQWWRENCLYLSPASAERFLKACVAAHVHPVMLKGGVSQDKLDENWLVIDNAWDVIADDVRLHGLGAIAQPGTPTARGPAPKP
jgi:hypothetical protein